MTKGTLTRSPIWDRLHEGPMADPYAIDLESFRSSGPLFAISVWDPEHNGLRYLKTLLYRLMDTSDAEDIEMYKHIANRDVGRPITVSFGGVDVCLDYFQAVDEVKTIAASGFKSHGARVLEVGPGYGRTCHALTSLHPNIGEYWLVDLEPCLVLAQRYLERVLDTRSFAKLRFVTVAEFETTGAKTHFDMVINVDSFGDLPPEVGQAYLELIRQNADLFYCKNPVGKYLDPALGQESTSGTNVQQALQSGLLRDIIDIFNSTAVAAAVPKFLATYAPGPDWSVAVDRPAPPWSYYHQAVFRRNGASKQHESRENDGKH